MTKLKLHTLEELSAGTAKKEIVLQINEDIQLGVADENGVATLYLYFGGTIKKNKGSFNYIIKPSKHDRT